VDIYRYLNKNNNNEPKFVVPSSGSTIQRFSELIIFLVAAADASIPF